MQDKVVKLGKGGLNGWEGAGLPKASPACQVGLPG